MPPTSARRSVVLCFLTLAFAALLNAEGMSKSAQTQPQGARRDVALHATHPLVRVSRALHLSTPRHELQAAIGRAGEDEIDTTVHLARRRGPRIGRTTTAAGGVRPRP